VYGLILKKTFFINQLQVEKAKYFLLESLISAYESSSDDSTKSSFVKSKKKRELKRMVKALSHTHLFGNVMMS